MVKLFGLVTHAVKIAFLNKITTTRSDVCGVRPVSLRMPAPHEALEAGIRTQLVQHQQRYRSDACGVGPAGGLPNINHPRT
ncbi:hypothetical protein F1C16_00500 [Hymenobacter sp. NBH84]|nr:hypothetical protein F1C16_00500 [Hymenobacter sp. NBH84]